MQIDYDSCLDTLYINRNGEKVEENIESEYSSNILISYNDKNQVIGVIFIDVEKVTPIGWSNFPERNTLPIDIVESIDKWIFLGVKAG